MRLEIDCVETFVLRLPPRSDFRWLSLSRPLGEFVLARVEAQGAEGWGEVVALRDWGDIDGRRHGETPATVVAVVHDQFGPSLLEYGFSLGELPARLDSLLLGHPYAKALLDIAVHDLVGRLYDVPVHMLLGGHARERVPIAHMLGLMSTEEAVEEAHAAIEDGVLALQVKGGQDPSRDVELVRRLRDELGGDVVLRLDANGGYSGRAAARRQLEALSEAGADFVEQPVLGLEELAAATQASPVPVIADEACWSASDALTLVSRRAVDALSVYVGKPGGLSRAQSVCRIAAAARLPHDVNGALELGIGNAANLHLALASPAELLPCVIPLNAPAGSHTTATAGRYFKDDVIAEALPCEGGSLAAPTGSGLGVEVDRDKIDHYCVERRQTAAPARARGGS